jgi:hypothetical protein
MRRQDGRGFGSSGLPRLSLGVDIYDAKQTQYEHHNNDGPENDKGEVAQLQVLDSEHTEVECHKTKRH